eukprot:CAMPEP_0172785090 /NCGR_PEP_ID=MMETSP1074-20121228/205270_1 /TAXON_ID=2916 /ORGANISM="Ceratium fusus, Strain PA161109" /LENGTH=70 /DNA_ID=CAMNT_0013622095 /DNA_START=669 /DNA_END=877 /DNA_ORIENTATION=+
MRPGAAKARWSLCLGTDAHWICRGSDGSSNHASKLLAATHGGSINKIRRFSMCSSRQLSHASGLNASLMT